MLAAVSSQFRRSIVVSARLGRHPSEQYVGTRRASVASRGLLLHAMWPGLGFITSPRDGYMIVFTCLACRHATLNRNCAFRMRQLQFVTNAGIGLKEYDEERLYLVTSRRT